MDAFKVEECATDIKNHVIKGRGAVMFLAGVLEDCQQQPEATAAFVKHGLLQPKLEAIFALIDQTIYGIEKNAEGLEKELEKLFDLQEENKRLKEENKQLVDMVDTAEGDKGALMDELDRVEAKT